MSDEIKEEAGKAFAKDMNTNSGAVVYAMARDRLSLPFGTKLKSAKVKIVHNRGCEITAVTCKSDTCEMKSLTYPFRPYVKSKNELKRRLATIRNQVCAPKIHWLVTKPFALLVLLICAGLGYGTMVLGTNGMLEAIAQAPRLQRGIAQVFGSASMFVKYVQASWYVCIVAHLVEAVLAAIGCSTTLGLNAEVTFSWFILVWMVGFPIFQEFDTLMKMQYAIPAKAK
uniref:Uncharacterized protein n=1 Tax=Craspedostauros australis TaxID=1486917 RepID=A0A7R9WQU3_9STRA|mmetsp:Transcript_16566/g.45899  ORF Transcript_16566/g.45899 Transcript_16566/m.45899 type:complete len:227 (+) Transcript_16566:118-798(+)|eukprot:CAMPEP_0198117986 /NCGR_PEP_ID=MMETSP1442-20131203/19959_1 /TAXON_ID= /ORGANISM="Craspedostauros australis, Strain CCMP3328" /LENGTH=226 /DNA_ID=CAMNT_0043776155 /DNA_START=44 /DNA_END=724 /DNA_ORIENTATION=-